MERQTPNWVLGGEKLSKIILGPVSGGEREGGRKGENVKILRKIK